MLPLRTWKVTNQTCTDMVNRVYYTWGRVSHSGRHVLNELGAWDDPLDAYEAGLSYTWAPRTQIVVYRVTIDHEQVDMEGRK